MCNLDSLLGQIRACQLCAHELPCGPRPVVQAGSSARLLIVGQAPGRKVRASGVPFDDASGQRLRNWQQLPDLFLALPHPSPRNQLWLRNNPWFEQQLLPELRRRMQLLAL